MKAPSRKMPFPTAAFSARCQRKQSSLGMVLQALPLPSLQSPACPCPRLCQDSICPQKSPGACKEALGGCAGVQLMGLQENTPLLRAGRYQHLTVPGHPQGWAAQAPSSSVPEGSLAETLPWPGSPTEQQGLQETWSSAPSSTSLSHSPLPCTSCCPAPFLHSCFQ